MPSVIDVLILRAGNINKQVATIPVIVLALILLPNCAMVDTWRGLQVAPEARCSQYEREDYPYSQSVELQIIRSMGGRVYGPYTGTNFGDRGQTDIEHVVATSEAHDSGLCAASASVRAQFASDLLNLTLASPGVNRGQKSGKDAAEWLPAQNKCWFADRVVKVRKKYGLSIDRREADALERVFASCRSFDLVFYAGPVKQRAGYDENEPALRQWDDNKNGKITCKEASKHGIAPVSRGHPAYEFMTDGDGDGVVCE